MYPGENPTASDTRAGAAGSSGAAASGSGGAVVVEVASVAGVVASGVVVVGTGPAVDVVWAVVSGRLEPGSASASLSVQAEATSAATTRPINNWTIGGR